SCAVGGEIGRSVALCLIGEVADVRGERAVLTKSAVELQLGRGAKLDLRPSSNGIERNDLRVGVGERAVEQDAPAQCRAEATNRCSAIERGGDCELMAEWQIDVGNAGPAVNQAIEAPVLTAVIATCTDGKGLAQHGAGVGGAGSISRLTRLLARIWTSV